MRGQRSPPRPAARGAPRAGARLGQGPGLAAARPTLGYPEEYGGHGDIGGYISGFETMAFGDLSLLVKLGVQFGLFGGAVQHLGTEQAPRALPGRHRHAGAAGLLRDDRGLGHGSNVQDLRTTATYDPEAERVRDPHARRLGAQGVDRQRGARRPHGRRVRPADRRRRGARRARAGGADPRRGRRAAAAACGSRTSAPSSGLDGVDNGRLWFDQVRVPRENLLDRYATVSPEGGYHQPDREPDQALLLMLGTLIQGRISVCGAAINASKVALDHRRAPRATRAASSARPTARR